MSYRVLDLRGLAVDRVERRGGELALRFAAGRIEKTMDNAEQRTLWRQAGALVVTAPRAAPALPAAPFVVAGADVIDGLYTQRDMVRVPLDAGGEVALLLRVAGAAEPVRVAGARLRLELAEPARYVRHLD